MILSKSRPHGRRGLHARDDRGATAVEYGLMVSLIALVIIGGVAYFGTQVRALFIFIVDSHPFG